MKKSDVLKIKSSQDALKDGLNYALISWTSTFNRMGKPNPYSRMQKILLGVAAEVDFQNFLKAQNIKFDLKGQTKWYQVDRYDISVKGKPIDVKANVLDDSTAFIEGKMAQYDNDISSFVYNCHALVPLDQFNCTSKRKIKNKIYVFPFIKGHFETQSNQHPLVHAFWDYKWLKKGDFKNDPTAEYLKINYSGASPSARIRIFGTSAPNTACIEDVRLSSPNVMTANKFYQVFSILWLGEGVPTAKIKIRRQFQGLSETINNTIDFELVNTENGYVPSANNWQSMHFSDYELYIAGWADEDDMRINGEKIPRFFKKLEQYQETKVDNWGCLVKDLNPIKDL